MGHFEIAGEGARALLDRLQTRNLAPLAPGRLAYTLLLRPGGTVFIDTTVWCLARDRYWLFTGRRSDFGFVAEAVREPGVDRAGSLGCNAVLAVQGPDRRGCWSGISAGRRVFRISAFARRGSPACR